MKLRDLTEKTTKSGVNLLTGKSIRKKKKIIPKKKKLIIDNIDTVLEIKEDEGTGISSATHALPEDAQKFLNNANIKQIKAGASETLYILDNGYSLKIIDVTIKQKKKQRIVIKKGKKTILDTYTI